MHWLGVDGHIGSEPMGPRAKEQKNLSRLERAAQKTADPKAMDQQAEKPEEKFRFSLRKEDVWWTVGFAAAALLGTRLIEEFVALERDIGALTATGRPPSHQPPARLAGRCRE